MLATRSTIAARSRRGSDTAIVVADTANPTGGFTDAEYCRSRRCSTRSSARSTSRTSGTPSDIDKNGKIVIFFTKEVNKLTPRGSAGGTVGGFFFERDLFPARRHGGLRRVRGQQFRRDVLRRSCPIPPGGSASAQQKTDVLDVTPGTLAHEYQHLINAGRRLYVNNARRLRRRLAERRAEPHRRRAVVLQGRAACAAAEHRRVSAIDAHAASIDAFNNYQGDNNGRFELFIGKPSQTSVYGGNDSLETRGATWHMLRYLADHRGAIGRRHVDAAREHEADAAIAICRDVFGANYMTQIRDWATSVFSDDVPA